MGKLSIIFDLDGTLLDTLQDIAETANAVLACHGFPSHPQQAYKGFVGDGLLVLMQRITPHGTEASVIHSCFQQFSHRYAETWRNNCRPYEGIADMLDTIKRTGVRSAILSNKPHSFTQLFIKGYFPDHPFSAVFGQRSGFAKKPDPAVALEIAQMLHTNPADMLFVGDTSVDIQTGKASGMITVGVSWGFRSVSELEKENPDILIKHPSELVYYVLSHT